MRDLNASEIENVEGGIVPLLAVAALALLGSGCATTGELRRGEEAPE